MTRGIFLGGILIFFLTKYIKMRVTQRKVIYSWTVRNGDINNNFRERFHYVSSVDHFACDGG